MPTVDPFAGEPVPPTDGERRQAERPTFQLWKNTPGTLPLPLLAAHAQSGAVLTIGEVCLLSGAGGVGKSMLTGSLALGFAMTAENSLTPLPGQIFDGVGGPVLMAAYEDHPAVIAHRLRRLTREWRGFAEEGKLGSYTPDNVDSALGYGGTLKMKGWPLYGPAGADGQLALYNARPAPLEGWAVLWETAHRIGAKLVIIDPAKSAYVGEANAQAPVQEFLDALGQQAEDAGLGVLVVAHSNKTARAGRDVYDPGQVAGSAAWADGVRGVLTLTRQEDGGVVLAVAKANWGPAYIHLPLDRIETQLSGGQRVPVGYRAGGEWTRGQPKDADTLDQYHPRTDNERGRNDRHRTRDRL